MSRSDTPAPATMLPSPCVGICRLDPGTGWCLGCARSADELTLWRDLPPDRQAEVWAELPRRKAVLGLAFRLLPHGGSSLSDCLARLALTPGTGWSIGVYGAIAEFMAHEGETLLLLRIEFDEDVAFLDPRAGRYQISNDHRREGATQAGDGH